MGDQVSACGSGADARSVGTDAITGDGVRTFSNGLRRSVTTPSGPCLFPGRGGVAAGSGGGVVHGHGPAELPRLDLDAAGARRRARRGPRPPRRAGAARPRRRARCPPARRARSSRRGRASPGPAGRRRATPCSASSPVKPEQGAPAVGGLEHHHRHVGLLVGGEPARRGPDAGRRGDDRDEDAGRAERGDRAEVGGRARARAPPRPARAGRRGRPGRRRPGTATGPACARGAAGARGRQPCRPPYVGAVQGRRGRVRVLPDAPRTLRWHAGTMPAVQTALLPLCIGLGLLGVVVAVIAFARGRRGRALQGLAFALGVVALYLTGLLRLVWDAVVAVVRWATGNVFDLAGVDRLRRARARRRALGRRRRRRPPQPPSRRRPSPRESKASAAGGRRPDGRRAGPDRSRPTPQQAGRRPPQQPAQDEDMAEIEALLKSRGIQ